MKTNSGIMWYWTSLVFLMIPAFVGAVTVTIDEWNPAGGCRVKSWSSWSPCPVSCGHGKHQRARIYQNGKTCMIERQARLCFRARCPAPTGAPCPSPWGSWTACSVTCGGGTRLRFRNDRGHPQETCFVNPESAACEQQPCNITLPVIKKCKRMDDVTSASLSPKQLYLPEDISLHRCARLVYNIIAPLSYGVNLTVSANSNFNGGSNSRIRIIEQTGMTRRVLYKGDLQASGYHSKSNTLMVELRVDNAPLFSGVTLSFEAYKINGHGPTIKGCPSQCDKHASTLPAGMRGILSLPVTSQLCVIMVWVINPLFGFLNKGSLLFQFQQLTLPPTDYIEVRDGESPNSSVIYKGQILPLRLFTSGLSNRVTLHICNTSLYGHFQITYQLATQQKAYVEMPQTIPTMSSTHRAAATDVKTTMLTPTSTPPTSSSDGRDKSVTYKVVAQQKAYVEMSQTTPTMSFTHTAAATDVKTMLTPTSTPHTSSSDSRDKNGTHIVKDYATEFEAKPTSNLSPTTNTLSMSLSPGSKPVGCSVEQIPKYLQPSPKTTLYAAGSTMTVSCSQTKKRLKGQNTFSCSEGDTWLPDKWPRCINQRQKKKCFDPPQVANAYFRQKVYYVGNKVTYVCKTRYQISGNQTLTCVNKGGELGEWNMPPKCQTVSVPCNVTNWGQWSPCSLACGEGTQHRSRIQTLDGNIANCRAEQEKRPCPVIEPCPTPQVFWPCGGNIQESRGQLASPGYPYGYISNQECIWKITVKRGQKILLRFHEIDTEHMFDIVDVRDGGYNNSHLLGEFSGKRNNTKVQSTGNMIYIRLLTDGTNEGKGFHAWFSSGGTPQHASCGDDLTASHDLQTFMLHPSSKTIKCSWTISTIGQHCCSGMAALRLNISMTDIKPKEEVLEVRDGATQSSPLVGIFSGREPHGHQNWLLDLHSCYAYIHYWSVGGTMLTTNSTKGFSLSYQVVEY